MRETLLKHEFVEFIPEALNQGTIYVSIAYAIAAHKCCCGCGQEVVTPLSPAEWQLTFDGVSVSLYPSIGNWSFDCQSHYWIERNRVMWARQWSKEEIEGGRDRDSRLKERFYGGVEIQAVTGTVTRAEGSEGSKPAQRLVEFWRRLKRSLF
jgi:Family of unknown function (DUF6527)